jgi:hypothetical protein
VSTASIQVTGEPVVISYLADPLVGRGQFRLENHGDSTAQTAVESVWLRIDRQRQPVSHISLFDVGTERPLDPEHPSVAPGETVTFLLGFPRVPSEGSGDVAVGLRLAGGTTPIEAESHIQIVRRIPRTS